MLDKLLDLVRQNSNDAIISNPSIPNEKNEQAVENAGSSILDTLKNALSGGNINEVLGYFKGGTAAAPNLVQEATGTYAQGLQNKLGIDAGQAESVANKVVPATMNQLAAKTADSSDNSFNIQDIFNNLSGGKTGALNIQAMLNKFGGGQLDKDNDGDVDLQDLKALLTGGTGGLMDKVKGMF